MFQIIAKFRGQADQFIRALFPRFGQGPNDRTPIARCAIGKDWTIRCGHNLGLQGDIFWGQCPANHRVHMEHQPQSLGLGTHSMAVQLGRDFRVGAVVDNRCVSSRLDLCQICDGNLWRNCINGGKGANIHADLLHKTNDIYSCAQKLQKDKPLKGKWFPNRARVYTLLQSLVRLCKVQLTFPKKLGAS